MNHVPDSTLQKQCHKAKTARGIGHQMSVSNSHLATQRELHTYGRQRHDRNPVLPPVNPIMAAKRMPSQSGFGNNLTVPLAIRDTVDVISLRGYQNVSIISK